MTAFVRTAKLPQGAWRIFQDSRFKQALRPLVHRFRRMPGRVAMRVGRISSLTPLSTIFGFDRGTPIDRLYIEAFLARHASDIRGHVLEVGDDGYSRRFGGGRITKQDILNIDPAEPLATIVGDLADLNTLPENQFDCVILTQTLQLVFDLPSAIKHVRRSLRPGGVLLITVPAIGPLCADQWQESFYWSFTTNSIARLLRENFDPQQVEVSSFGNLYAAVAFLHGAAIEEVDRKKLDPVDPSYAITIAARAVA